MNRAANITIWIVAIFYAYGAFVHIMNILGQSGFDWLAAPRKWQALDVFYLVLDVVVAVGLFLNWKIAFFCFYVAATTQIVLYTVFRGWILDVPEEFAVAPEQADYLWSLVAFHIVTLVLVTGALLILNRQTGA